MNCQCNHFKQRVTMGHGGQEITVCANCGRLPPSPDLTERIRDLENAVIDLKAALRCSVNAAANALEQYKDL